jgi:hypothetical protein
MQESSRDRGGVPIEEHIKASTASQATSHRIARTSQDTVHCSTCLALFERYWATTMVAPTFQDVSLLFGTLSRDAGTVSTGCCATSLVL